MSKTSKTVGELKKELEKYADDLPIEGFADVGSFETHGVDVYLSEWDDESEPPPENFVEAVVVALYDINEMEPRGY